MCVVGHGHSGLGVGRDGGSVCYACGTQPEVMVVYRKMLEHFPGAR